MSAPCLGVQCTYASRASKLTGTLPSRGGPLYTIGADRARREAAPRCPLRSCSVSMPSRQTPKWGVLAGGQHSARVLTTLQPFSTSHISWLYNYNSRPEAFLWEGADGAAYVGHNPHAAQLPGFMDEHNLEFMPMVSGRAFQPINGPSDARGICWLVTGLNGQPSFYRNYVPCSVAQIVTTLVSVRETLRVPTRYLMAANEPWFAKPEAMSPAEGVDIWRMYLQPAAAQAGLQLISPTVQLAFVSWLSDFLRICYDLRADSRWPCDVESMAAISVHEYSCKESFWRDGYQERGGRHGFRDAVSSALRGHGGKDWNGYLRTRRFWVTGRQRHD